VTTLLRPGASLAVTDGHDGGSLIKVLAGGRTRAVSWAAVPPARVIDPTGAGDVFLAALVGAMVRPDLTAHATVRRPASELAFAAATASFVVEAPGLLGVPDRAAVLRRLRWG
jgi:sugar/nucleoside kinase (ribokinase family)